MYEFILHNLTIVMLYIILAVSYDLVMGYGGMFSMAHAAFYGIGAYTSAILSMKLGLSFFVTVWVGMIVAAAIAVLLAIPALRVAGDYLAIASFGFMMIAYTAFNNLDITGGSAGLKPIPRPALFGFAIGSPEAYLVLSAALAAFCIAIAWRLTRSPFGLVLQAMREDEVAAQSFGKNTVAFKVFTFMISGALASVAGALVAHYIRFTYPDYFTLDESILVLAIVIVGGAGNLRGAVVGAIVLTMLPTVLRFLALPDVLAGQARLMIYGLLLVLFAVFRPQGLAGIYLGREDEDEAGDGKADAGPAPAFVPAIATTGSGVSVRPRLGTGGVLGVGSQTRAVAAPLAEAAPSPAPASTNVEEGAILQTEQLGKRFGGITAVDGLTCSIREGKITSLVGPNGAGKTTAFNLITGYLRPDQGKVFFRSRDVTALPPYKIAGLGIARSFQDVRIFGKMSVLDNVLVARQHQSREAVFPALFGFGKVMAEEKEHRKKASSYLEFVGLAGKANVLAENIGFGEQKLLSIARLLATEADLLLLDEPMSGLDPSSVGSMLKLLRSLTSLGRTVCLVEHNMDVVKEVSDWILFLHQGKLIADGLPQDIVGDPQLEEIYFGT